MVYDEWAMINGPISQSIEWSMINGPISQTQPKLGKHAKHLQAGQCAPRSRPDAYSSLAGDDLGVDLKMEFLSSKKGGT